MSITSWLESFKARLLGAQKKSKTRNRQGERAQQATKAAEPLEVRTLLTVNPLNDFYSINEDAVLTSNAPGVLSNDPAGVGNSNVNQLSNPLHGSALILTDGTFTFDPTASGALQSLNAGQQSIQSVTYNVLDDGDLSVGTTATVFVTVTGRNDQVSATGLNQTVNYTEDDASATTATPIILDDADSGDIYTVNLSLANASAGTFSLASTTGLSFSTGSGSGDTTMSFSGLINDVNAALATLTFNPAANFDQDTSISVSIQDGNEHGTTAINGTIALDVTGTADNFSVNSPTFAIDENSSNGTSVGSVVATDPDTGDSHTFTITNGNTGGVFAINSATGEITVDDSALLNYEGATTYTLTVEVTDSAMNLQTSTVTINVSDLNEAPVFTPNGPFSLDENTTNGSAVGNAGGVVDPDAGDTYTYAITAGNTNSAFAIDPLTGDITVADSSALNFEVTPSFSLTIEVEDAEGLSHSGTVVINLNDVNEAPTITSAATANVAENTTAVITVTSTDPDAGATAAYSIVGGADQGLFGIDPVTGALTFNAPPDFETLADADTNNVYEVQVQVTDGANPVTQNIAVTVTNVNEAPTITSAATANVEENTTAVLTVTSTDEDAGATATYSIVGGVDQLLFSIDPVTGVLTFQSAPDVETPLDDDTNNEYNVTVQVSDGSMTDTVGITVTVTNANEAPTITSAATANVAENTSVVLTVTSFDQDVGATDTYSIVGGADQARFSIDPVTGALTFNAPPDFETPTDANADNVYLVQVQVTDGALTDTQNIAVTVTNVNEAPTLTSLAGVNVIENEAAVQNVTATDPDAGTTLTYSIIGGTDAADFTINPTTGALTFNTLPDFENPHDSDTDNVYEVEVQVSDGTLSDSHTITVTVTNESPERPVFTSSPTANVSEGTTPGTTVLVLTATDSDSVNPFIFPFQITGGADAAQFYLSSLPMSWTADLVLNFTPDFENPVDANGDNVYEVEVTVTDDTAQTRSQLITITVTNENDAPVITAAGPFSVAENTTAIGSVVATDEDVPANTLGYTILPGDDSNLISIDSNTGALSFNMAPDYETPGSFMGTNSYTVYVDVFDGTTSTGQLVTINVTDANESPVISSLASATVNENQTAAIDVNATDPEAGVLTYSISGGADQALFAIDSVTGVVTFNSAPNFEAPADADQHNDYEVQVTVTDGVSTAAVQNITITVADVNDAPQFITFSIHTSGYENDPIDLSSWVQSVVDEDLPPDTLTFSLVGADAALFTINPTTGELTGGPFDYEVPTDAGANNTYEFTVEVNDGNGGNDSFTVSFQILDSNELPVITTLLTASVAENQLSAIDVDATDPESGVITYSITGGADQALFNIDPNTGEVTFITAPDFENPTDADANSTYVVQVQAHDGNSWDAETFTITVTDVNDAPVFTAAGPFTIAENTTAIGSVVATDEDVPANTLVYTIMPMPMTDWNLISIDSNTGALSFDVAPDYETPGSWMGTNTYLVYVDVFDGTVGTTQFVVVTVMDASESPVITSNATATVNENQTAAIDVDATDPEMGALTYSITGGADQALFAIDPSTGVVTFNTAPNFEVPTDADGHNDYEIVVSVSDGVSAPTTQNITITVADVNDAPVLTSLTAVSVNENTTAVQTVTASDEDVPADTLIYTITGAGPDDAFFSINPMTGELTFNVAQDFENPQDFNNDNVYQVMVQVYDGTTVDYHTVSVTVTNVDESPVINSLATATVDENQTGAIDVDATDPDAGAMLTYSITGGADQALFTINPSTGVVTFNTAPNFEVPGDADSHNDYEIVVSVSDGVNPAVTQNITITVADANDAPVISAGGPFSIAENSTAVGTVVATDEDTGDTVTYSIFAMPMTDSALFSIDSTTGELSFNVAPDFENPGSLAMSNAYTVFVQFTDGSVTTGAYVTVTVTNVDESPVITSGATATVDENQTGAIDVDATDPESGVLTYSITGGADMALFTIDPSTGVVTFNTAPDYENPGDADHHNDYEIVVSVTDGLSIPTMQNITITVADANDAPVITSLAIGTAAENQTAVMTVTASDEDLPADTLTYSIVGTGDDDAFFTINPSTGALSFIHAPDYETPADFNGDNVYQVRVQVSDGTLTDAYEIAVTVTDVNEAPTANDDIAVVDEDGTVNIHVLDNDSDPEDDALLIFSSAPTHGTATVNDNGTPADLTDDYIVYTPNSNYNGPDSFSYIVLDGNGNQDSATVNITVNSVNDAPGFIASGPFTLAENSANSTIVGTVVAIDPFDAPSPNNITYSITGGNDSGAFAINSVTGEISVVDNAPLDFEVNPSFTLEITATDDGVAPLASTANVTITLTNENEAPTMPDDTLFVDENSPNGTVVGTVSAGDPDAGDTFTFTITAGNLLGIYAIDNNGQITVADNTNLNYENVNNAILTIEVEDAQGLTDTATITINVNNVNEAPVINDNGTTLAENSSNGTVVGTITGYDPDLLAILSYSITGGTGAAYFAIDPSSGEITVTDNSGLDFETNPVLTLTVEASDGTLTDTATYTITLTNENEAPVIDDNTLSLPENSSNGTVVGMAGGTDVDAGDILSYSVTGGTGAAYFAVDPSTGEITVTDSTGLDYETHPTYTLVIEVEDHDGLTDTATVTINLTDVNEPPVYDDATFSLAENSGNATIVGLLTGVDPDAASTVTFSIAGGNTGGAFSIGASTGLISVANAAALDFETNPTFTLSVDYTDGTHSGTATVTINLTNVNEAPIYTPGGALGVAELSANGTVVGSAGTATDPDTGDTLTYSIISGNGLGGFAINPTTGEITVANGTVLDFEGSPTHNLGIQVSDVGGLTSSGMVTINLVNTNEAPTVTPAAFSVTENSPNGTAVGTVTSTDPDAGDTKTFSITDGNTNGAFAINPTTGQITVANTGAINFETTPVFVLTVQVQDHDGLTGTATVTVNLNNINDPLILNLPSPDPKFVANTGAVIIDALADVYDEDTPNIDYRNGTLVITIIDGGTANDRLEIRNQGNGPGQIKAGGKTLYYEGSKIGTYTGGTGTTPISITFSNTVTDDAVIALLRMVTFRVRGTPTLDTRTVLFELSDSTATNTASNSKNINVALTSDAPVVTLPGAATEYTLGTAPVLLHPTATVVDADSPSLDGGTLVIQILNGPGKINSNRLSVQNQGTGSGQISVDGNNLYYEGRILGKITAGGNNSLHIDLLDNATPASVQALLRSIQFHVNTGSVNTQQRSFSVILNDGDGATSTAATGTINVSAAI